jgi:hypothetical protein
MTLIVVLSLPILWMSLKGQCHFWWFRHAHIFE